MPNDIDRNADTHLRHKRNWQRLKEGAATGTIIVQPPLVNGPDGITFASVQGEVPSGSVNNTNPTFTLAHSPTTGSEAVYLNGNRLTRGGSNDYTITGTTITFNTPPKTGDKILVDYLRLS